MDTYAGDPTSWIANVRYIEDGDDPNETNLFPSVEDLADRTAHIKDGDTTFTGDKIHQGEQTFNGGATVTTDGWNFSSAPVIMSSSVHVANSIGHDVFHVGDADQTIGNNARYVRITALTGTRNYWVPTTPDTDTMTGNPKQATMRIIRSAGLTAATVNIRTGSAAGTILGGLPNDATFAWIEIMYTGATHGWRVIGGSSNSIPLVT